MLPCLPCVPTPEVLRDRISCKTQEETKGREAVCSGTERYRNWRCLRSGIRCHNLPNCLRFHHRKLLRPCRTRSSRHHRPSCHRHTPHPRRVGRHHSRHCRPLAVGHSLLLVQRESDSPRTALPPDKARAKADTGPGISKLFERATGRKFSRGKAVFPASRVSDDALSGRRSLL